MEANAKLVWRPKKDGSIQATKKGQGKLKTRRFLIPKDQWGGNGIQTFSEWKMLGKNK